MDMASLDKESALANLISLWQRRRSEGEVVSPAELCRERPELLPSLERQIAALERLEAHAQALQETATVLPQCKEAQAANEAGSLDPYATLPPDAQAQVPAPTDAPVVPGYEVLGILGKGGMGIVYKARQTRLNRLVALKMILHSYAGSEERLRFQIEAEAVASLHHAHIVQVFEVGEHQGSPYLSLEYCVGGSLADKLNGTPWEAKTAAQLVEMLARAMETAHLAKVIHRDLKPGNVLLTATGEAKVTDFGLAKKLDVPGRTQTGAVMGTPSYMAPEQARGRKDIGPAADVYALGAILYELLTGRPPFKADTTLDTILKVVNEEPLSVRQLQPQIPRDIETVCQKCLQKEPKKRYGSALELAEDLRRFVAGEPVSARRVGRIERGWRWCRRNPVVSALIASVAGLMIVVGALGVDLWFWIISQNPQQTSSSEVVSHEEPASSAPKPAPLRTKGEKLAFLVGVRSYQLGELKMELDFTEQDVEELARTLNKHGYQRKNIHLLTQWNEADNPALSPTGVNIRQQLRRVLEECIPSDSILVMLTGAGGNMGDPRMYAYLPADAQLNNSSSLISQAELYSLFAECRAGFKLLLVDTCQTVVKGNYTWPNLPALPRGLAVYFSCSPGEASFELAKLGHGVFSHHVITGLDGTADANRDGIVTLDELVQHTNQGVRKLIDSELPGEVQTPTLIAEVSGSTALVERRADDVGPK